MPRRQLTNGDRRLLHDLAVLHRALDAPRVSARRRLERKVGPDLARILLAQLATPIARAA